MHYRDPRRDYQDRCNAMSERTSICVDEEANRRVKTRKKLMTTPNRELKIKIDYKKCPIFGRDYNPKIGAINTPPLAVGRES